MRKRLKITAIISITEIVLLISAIFVSITLYISSNEGIKEQEISIVEKQSDSFVNRFDSLSVKFQEISVKISNLNERKLLSSYYYDSIDDQYGKIKALNDISDYLENYVLTSTCVNSVGAKFQEIDGKSYPILHTSSVTSGSALELDYILNNVTFYKDEINYYIYNEHLYYLFSTDIDDSFKIAIDLNIEEFANLFEIDTNLNTPYFNYLIKDNRIIFSLSNYQFSDSDLANLKIENLKNFHTFVSSKELNENVYLRTCLNLNNLSNRGMASIVYLIIGIVLITIIGCITLLLLNLYMRKPINEIQVALKNISKGNFNYRIEYKTKSDLQELIDGINSMSEMLNTYIDEKYLQEIRVKDAKFKVLQSQIHPHFLYNCFATIQSLIKMEDYNKALELTKQMSLYYSYITKNKALIVSLKEEWDHMYKYLNIQKIRFEDNITYEIDALDEKYNSIQVPKIIFQPIVENSFKYAFKNIDNGILKIKISEENDSLFISFEDNGYIDEETIKSLNEQVYKENIETSGLINVCQRIMTYSQNKSKVIIEKGEELKGLKITFKLAK